MLHKLFLVLMLVLQALALQPKPFNYEIEQEEEIETNEITTQRIPESRSSNSDACIIPDDSELDKLSFRFYYGSTWTQYLSASCQEADKLLHHLRWRKRAPIAFFIHDYYDFFDTNLLRDLIYAYSESDTLYNLVALDWRVLKSDYMAEKSSLEEIATRVADGLALMLNQWGGSGARLSHIVGHGLGAHLAGAVSRLLVSTSPLVVGLDPSLNVCGDRLGPTDAPTVLVVHTDEGKLGSVGPSGTVDFFPNGGFRRQPGCTWWRPSDIRCSHERSLRLWQAVIEGKGDFIGRKCSSWKSFQEKECDSNEELRIATTSIWNNGSFFMWTDDHFPYGMGEKGAKGVPT